MTPAALAVFAGVTTSAVYHWLCQGKTHKCPSERSMRLIQHEMSHVTLLSAQNETHSHLLSNPL